MYFHRHRLITGLYELLFCLSFTRARDTLPQTIFSLPVFSSQKPCAQACFTSGPIAGCFQDMVGDALGCVNDNAGCTVGDSSIDISSAGSIYIDYCSSQGFPINVPAFTTDNPQATTTVASPSLQQTSPTNSGDSSAAPVPSSSPTTDPNAIAIGVGLGVGIPAIIEAILAWWFPCGHRRSTLR
ncbi:hypothetical protein NA56DRAFT_710414 [Hyaloscypha hepaticicola]|uniref:Extracellular membrane protein CFEM domain-containing protein n=1 Tax=Hyaloscypha hepaticicola TaxID=2082293 RepID=A0A2J6PLP5_9HELO|nr:hypothetical protein NA56DRAFT_710414 [Hyaloscypha hepaticicola]